MFGLTGRTSGLDSIGILAKKGKEKGLSKSNQLSVKQNCRHVKLRFDKSFSRW